MDHFKLTIWWFLIILTTSSASIWIKNVKTYSPTAAAIGVKCFSTISKYYFQDLTLTRSAKLVVSFSNNLTLPADNIQRLYLKWVHEAIMSNELINVEVQLITDTVKVNKVSHVQSNTIYEKDYYAIVMDDFKKFENLMRSYISQDSFNPGAKFVILFINPNVHSTKTTQRDLAYKLFQLMYDRFNVANVIFIYASDASAYNIYVTSPYQNKTHCGSLQPFLLDTCHDGNLHSSVIESWTNIQQIPRLLPHCTFKFCARVSEPYINLGCHSGLEIDIIEVSKEKLHFKICTFCTDMSRGESYGNGSWSGILGLLRNDQCDFVVGGFFPDYDVHDDFGVTAPYYQEAYTWFVFIAQRQPQWLAMINIFRYNTWILVFVVMLLSAATWWFIGTTLPEKSAHKNVTLCILNSFCVFLGVAANNRPHWNSLRILFIMLALYGINVTTVYTSKLINVFTNPAYEDQVDTVEEIIESDLPIGGREEYSDWFDNDNIFDQKISKIYNISEAFWPTVENLNSVAKGERVILTNRGFVSSKFIHNVFPLSVNVFANPLEMISERGFPLLKRFSNLIMFMRDAGIIQKLHADFQYNVTVLHQIRYRDSEEFEVTQIVLTMSHMDGAFTVLIFGLLISLVTFVVEIIVHSYERKRRARRRWNLLRKKWRQVSIMCSLQNDNKWNATANDNKRNKKSTKKVKFNMNSAFKSDK